MRFPDELCWQQICGTEWRSGDGTGGVRGRGGRLSRAGAAERRVAAGVPHLARRVGLAARRPGDSRGDAAALRGAVSWWQDLGWIRADPTAGLRHRPPDELAAALDAEQASALFRLPASL